MSIFNLLTIFIIIVSILLIATILLQEPKERLTPSGGGAASIQRIGINQKADFLEKTTWVLVALLLFLTLLSSVFLKSRRTEHISPNLASLEKEEAVDTLSAPNSTQEAAIDQKDKEPSDLSSSN